MAKPFTPVALTANDLLEGDAVWWTGEAWSPSVSAALIARDEAEAALLSARAADPAEGARVVGAYLVEFDQAGRPRLRREAIRADREPTFAYGAAAPLRDAA
ncbi:MAG: DUF2849 domain-containing protein [Pikeienuella sp.]|uniref:DUF2849 domain-containing protein n=1 Tax=Pikeienuella sp. TaxID=2831957 RepID=UPI00391987FE